MTNTTQTETAPTATTTIRLRGRDFAVTTQQTARGTMYILTGKRGAVYGTMRSLNHPTQMFIIHAASMDGVWLSDEHGSLEVLRA